MIGELNRSALLKADQQARDHAIIGKLNEMARAINTGVVWNNKIQAQREVEDVYNTLPLSVVAEIIEEEVKASEAELGL